jgi:hypothetical protein
MEMTLDERKQIICAYNSASLADGSPARMGDGALWSVTKMPNGDLLCIKNGTESVTILKQEVDDFIASNLSSCNISGGRQRRRRRTRRSRGSKKHRKSHKRSRRHRRSRRHH